MIKEFILSVVISWVLVKIIKTIIAWSKERKISLRVLFYDGGMPSSHTILTVSLATALFLEQGLSPLFVFSVFIAMLVMNDAIKVRWVTEEQSRIINRLTQGKEGFKKLDEHIGHKPIEVFVSLVLGIVIPIIVYAVI